MQGKRCLAQAGLIGRRGTKRIVQPRPQVAVGEQPHAQQRRQVRQRPTKARSELQLKQQQDGNERAPHLDLDRVGPGAHEGLDLEILFEGLEQRFAPDIPAGSVVFTSHAIEHMPTLSVQVPAYLAKLEPAAVFRFERSFDHDPKDALHGLLCQRYVEISDSNVRLLSLPHRQVDHGLIGVLLERRIVLGSNPLLPTSAIGWRPTR